MNNSIVLSCFLFVVVFFLYSNKTFQRHAVKFMTLIFLLLFSCSDLIIFPPLVSQHRRVIWQGNMGLVFFLRSVVFLFEMIRGRGKSILLREYVQHLIQIAHFGVLCYAHMIHCDEKNVMLY